MNGLLRHTGNVHIGMFRGASFNYLGVIWNGIKSGYTIVADGIRSASESIGLIKNTEL